MKILVLNGSPKKERSDVLQTTKAFLGGMENAGPQEIEIVHLIDQNIEFCRGCLSCMKNGGKCIFNDDATRILEKIISSDVCILSFPVYFYGFPAPLVKMINRMLPLGKITMKKEGDHYQHEGQRDLSKVHFVMISGCGFPDAEHNFGAVKLQFSKIFPECKTMLTVPESPLFNTKELSMLTGPKLESVKQAGKEYAEKTAVRPELISEICKPLIPEEEYAKLVNGQQ